MMPKHTFLSLVIAAGYGILGGLVSLMIVSSVQSGYYRHPPDEFFSDEFAAVIGGIVISLAGPFCFCIGFLLPLAAIEKKNLEKRGKKELLRRYLPLLALPVGVLLLLIITLAESSNDRCILFTFVLTAYGTCLPALAGFVRNIK
jgi:hypothetical protein